MSEFEHKEELVVGLFDIGEITYAQPDEQPRSISHAPPTPHFVDLRGIMSLSESVPVPLEKQRRIANLVIDAYCFGIDQIENKIKHIMGVPQALESVMGAISFKSGRSLLRLRIDTGHSRHSDIAGRYQEGDVVAALDNALSTGGSALEFASETEKDRRLLVSDFVVVVNREQGGEEALRRNGYGLVTITDMAEVTDILFENDRITAEQVERSRGYIAANY